MSTAERLEEEEGEGGDHARAGKMPDGGDAATGSERLAEEQPQQEEQEEEGAKDQTGKDDGGQVVKEKSPRIARGAALRQQDEAKLQEDPDALIKALKDAPKKKKNLEEDAKMLQNRIRHLKYELSKTKKKVAETTHRATEVMQMKQKNASRRVERERMMSSTFGSNRERTRLLKEQQELARQRLAQARKEKEEVARLEAERLRKMRDDAKKKTAELKRQEIEATKSKVLARKREQERKRMADKLAEQKHAEQLLRQSRRQLRKKRAENLELEAQVERLEGMERKWIDTLKASLEEQQRVYAQLEQELLVDANSSSTMFEG